MNINLQNTKKPSLRSRVLITISLLTLVRIGNFIPLPYIDREIFLNLLDTNNLETSPLLSILNTFSGGPSSSLGILSIGILPSINASIIMQVLTVTLPSFEKLKKEEGEYGRRKLNDYGRYLTLLCALIQSLSISYNLHSLVFDWNFWVGLEMTFCLTAGSMLVLWFSELITRNGVGNGSSLLICANIVSSLPNQLRTLSYALQDRSFWIPFFLIGIFYAITFFCVMINEARIEIPLISVTQLSQKLEKNQRKQKNVLPLKINQAGVMPLAFTSSLMVIFASIFKFLSLQFTWIQFGWITPIVAYWLEKTASGFFYGGLIFLSTYLYSTIVLDPKDIAKQFQKNSVVIRGVPPGSATKEYLTKTLRRLAALNAGFLMFMILSLNVAQSWLNVNTFNLRGFGLTSQIILASVVIDTMQKIRSSFGQEENIEN